MLTHTLTEALRRRFVEARPVLRWLAAIVVVVVSPWSQANAAQQTAGHRLDRALTVSIEENRGQFESGALFGARAAGSPVLFDDEGALIQARRANGEPWPLRLKAAGSTVRTLPVPEQPLPGQVHYYLGDDPANWHRGVHTWSRVRYAEVYDGIDLVYRGTGSRLEYDFVVKPGADPAVVEMAIDGAESVEIDASGGLVARSGDDTFHIAAPFLYQESENGISRISGDFVVRDGNRVAFTVGPYDEARALVIDPVMLGYSTRLGGSAMDSPAGIAVDDNGFIYVTGGTQSTDFAGAGSPAAGTDVFVSKITPDGESLLYTVLLGGNDIDDAIGIAADNAGNAYVTGQSQSNNFPTVNALDDTLGGDADYFVARLDPRGALEYSTYYGGNARDGEFDGGIALGPQGNVWITGRTQSVPPNGLPLMNPYENDCVFITCAFVAGFDTFQSMGASLVYGTYIGGDSDEGGKWIDVDDDGNVYVFGFTGSDADLIAPGQGFQPNSADVNNNDTFLIKLDPTLAGASQLTYSTYMSGPGDESEDGQVFAGDNGIVWVVGATSSVSGPLVTDFPNKNARQTQNGGDQDAFLMKIDTTLTGDNSLLFATFLGGVSGENGSAIAVDSSENIYVALSSNSFDFPIVAPLLEFQPFSPPDPLLVQLDPTAMTIETSTPMPGADRLAVDASDTVYIAGRTLDASYPLVNSLPPGATGATDVFLGAVNGQPLSGLTLEVEDVGDPIAVGDTVTFRYTMTNNGNVPISDLLLMSDVPAGLDLDPLPAVCFNSGGGIECVPNDLPFDTLQPGENLTWFVRGSSQTPGTFTVSNASVSTQPVDPDLSDNTASETIAVDASGSTPSGTLTIADFDAFGLTFDIGGFAIDTPQGVLATSNGSFDETVNFMVFNGSIPLHIVDIWNQGRVAIGVVDSANWPLSNGDGGTLFAPEAFMDRVFVIVDALGRIELRSAPPFSNGVLVDEAFIGLEADKAISIDVDVNGSIARVFYDGNVVAEGNPFVSGGANASQIGDDMAVSVGLGNEFLGAALLNSQAPAAPLSGGGGIPSGPQTCSMQGFGGNPRTDVSEFGWTSFGTGAFSLAWSTTDNAELCGGGAVPGGNFTGGSGPAACIDSDVVGPGEVNSYLCSPPIDISSSIDPDLQFRLNYQVLDAASGEDAVEILVGTAEPDPATIGSYESLGMVTDNVGVFAGTGEVQNFQMTPGEVVHVCFRYAANHDWYAQVDDVTVSADNCSGPAYP
ncbi:MAG: SBBP repeat-containing protein, partial [Pseudomonadota bacterium]